MEVTRIPGESPDRPGTLKCVYFKSRQKGDSQKIVVLESATWKECQTSVSRIRCDDIDSPSSRYSLKDAQRWLLWVYAEIRSPGIGWSNWKRPQRPQLSLVLVRSPDVLLLTARVLYCKFCVSNEI